MHVYVINEMTAPSMIYGAAHRAINSVKGKGLKTILLPGTEQVEIDTIETVDMVNYIRQYGMIVMFTDSGRHLSITKRFVN